MSVDSQNIFSKKTKTIVILATILAWILLAFLLGIFSRKEQEPCIKISPFEIEAKQIIEKNLVTPYVYQLNTGIICPSVEVTGRFYLAIIVSGHEPPSPINDVREILVVGYYDTFSIDKGIYEHRISHPFSINRPANDYLSFGVPNEDKMNFYGPDGAKRALDAILFLLRGYPLENIDY